MRIREFVALGSAVLMLAACGSSTKSGSDVPPASTTTTIATAPNTPKQLAADKATAKAAVLKLSDLTAGYKQIPPNPDTDDDFPPAALTLFASCAHIPKKEAAAFFAEDKGPKQPQAESDFMNKTRDLLEIDLKSNVELDRSTKDISEPFDALLAKTPLPCWEGLFDTAFAQDPIEGATLSPVKVTPLATTGLGDQALAFRATLTISGPSLSVNTAIDLYFVGHGRAGVTLEVTGVGHPADPSFERSLIEKMIARLDAAN